MFEVFARRFFPKLTLLRLPGVFFCLLLERLKCLRERVPCVLLLLRLKPLDEKSNQLWRAVNV